MPIWPKPVAATDMRYLIAAGLLNVILFGGYAFSTPTLAPQPSDIHFSLLDGRRLSLAQLHGRPVIVTFWATSCASCVKEIPQLRQLYQQYSAQGLEIIAVAMPYDRPDYVLTMTRQYQLPYAVALDIDGRLAHAFGDVSVSPMHFLIAPDGRIMQQQTGKLDIAKTEHWLHTFINTTKD